MLRGSTVASRAVIAALIVFGMTLVGVGAYNMARDHVRQRATISPDGHYVLEATDCPDPWGAQRCVDSQDVVATDFSPWGGPVWVGGHTKGSAVVILNLEPGNTVAINGSVADGSYLVTGSRWIPRSPIPSSDLGEGVVLQVCKGNSMRVVSVEQLDEQSS